MELKSVGVLSCAKLMGIMYAFMGLIFGAFVSLASLAGVAMNQQQGGPQLLPALFGAGAIVALPIFYGILGAIGGMISAAIYNLIAGFIGGIEMNFESIQRSA